MTIDTFIDNVREQFDDAPTNLSAETVFRDIDGWCSLVALSIIAMVDEEYDVALRGEDMKKAVTIQDLYNLVASKK